MLPFPNKSPFDTFVDEQFIWSDFLAPTSDTIISAEVLVIAENGVLLVDDDFNEVANSTLIVSGSLIDPVNQTVTFMAQGGIEGSVYQVGCKLVTTEGNIVVRGGSITVKIL
jgi:hypothetical protein